MDWKGVGDWLKGNAGAGVALVSSATGEADPGKVLERLQTDPATVLRLRELAIQDEASIREHIRAMTELEFKDRQAEHEQAQLTIRSGDNAEDAFVRRTRPGQSWLSLAAALAYVAWREVAGKEPSFEVLALLLTLPWAYAGLRQIGKGMGAFGQKKKAP